MYGLISFLLKLYFVGFLRVVNFVSRKKEHRADELAGVPRGPEKQNGRPGLKRDARFVFL